MRAIGPGRRHAGPGLGGGSTAGHRSLAHARRAARRRRPRGADTGPAAARSGQPPAAPGGGGRGGPQIEVPWNDAIPPGTADHAMRALKEISRHGEWADIKMADGGVLKSWVVYPERAQKAGVVLVIHDIRGMSDMARAMGDQLAQDGFIAIVPDFLSGKGPNGGGTESLGSGVGKTIQGLTPADVVARLNAAMEYGKKLPASNGKTGVVGFCWGGARSFGVCRGAAGAERRGRLLRRRAGLGRQHAGEHAGQREGAGARALRRQRRADQRDGAGDRSGDEEARQELRDAHLRRRRPRLHVRPGRRRRRQLKAAQESWPVVLQFFRKNLQ